jgi:hypothetical protein
MSLQRNALGTVYVELNNEELLVINPKYAYNVV